MSCNELNFSRYFALKLTGTFAASETVSYVFIQTDDVLMFHSCYQCAAAESTIILKLRKDDFF